MKADENPGPRDQGLGEGEPRLPYQPSVSYEGAGQTLLQVTG